MNKGEFAGTGKVFAFTFTQHYKSKSTIISLVIFFLMAAATLPIVSHLMPDTEELSDLASSYYEESWEELFQPYRIYVDDRAGLDMIPELETALAEVFPETFLMEVSEKPADGDLTDVYVLIEEGPTVMVSDFSDSFVPADTLDMVGYLVSDAIDERAAEAVGVSPETVNAVYDGYTTDVVRESEMEGNGGEETFSETSFGVAYGYAALVMMFSIISSSYIVRALVDEKSSKLMETLLLSVKPLALIVGKILAVLCWLACGLGVMAIGFGCSAGVTVLLHFLGHGPEMAAVMESFSGSAVGSMVTGMNGTVIPAALFSLLLSYATFSLIGGFFGSGCSTLEDAGGANSGAVLIGMLCYFIAVIQAVVPSHTLAVIVSLVPVLSCFCGPLNYMSGNVELWVLLIAWVLQLGTIAVLARLTGNVFRNLVMYQGNRVRLGKLLAYARQPKGGVRA